MLHPVSHLNVKKVFTLMPPYPSAQHHLLDMVTYELYDPEEVI